MSTPYRDHYNLLEVVQKIDNPPLAEPLIRPIIPPLVVEGSEVIMLAPLDMEEIEMEE